MKAALFQGAHKPLLIDEVEIDQPKDHRCKWSLLSRSAVSLWLITVLLWLSVFRRPRVVRPRLSAVSPTICAAPTAIPGFSPVTA